MNRQTDRHRTKLITVNNHSHNCPLITKPQEVTLLPAGAAPCTDQRDPGESVYSGNTGVLLRQVKADHAHMSVYTSASLSQPLLQRELFLAAGSLHEARGSQPPQPRRTNFRSRLTVWIRLQSETCLHENNSQKTTANIREIVSFSVVKLQVTILRHFYLRWFFNPQTESQKWLIPQTYNFYSRFFYNY